MSEEITRDLIKRYQQATADRSTVQQMWDAIEQFITPYRGRFFQDQKSEHSIDWYNSRQIYDSTAVMAHKNLSASLHGDLTSPSIKWFAIRFRNQDLNKNKAAVEWLQSVTDRIYFELQDSNFDSQINQLYQDLVGFGTGIMTLEEQQGEAGQWNGLSFQSVPLKEGYFEQDWKGQVQRFYRALEWTPQEILSKFGDDAPDEIRKLDQDGSVAKQDVIFCIYPRNNKIMKWGEKLAENERPWSYCYILKKSGKMIGSEGGYYEMPTYIPRWDTTNSSQWGHSPAMDALGDVLTLNELVKTDLRARAKKVDPPIFVEERSNITDLNIGPRTVSVVRSIAGVKAFDTQGSMQASEEGIARLQFNIRSYFMIDHLDFPDVQAQPMTATEAQIRYERKQRYLSATLGHLRNDLLNPIIERAFLMLVRDGEIEQPPEIVIERNAEIDIQYMGSLVRAQQVDSVTAIERTMMAAAQFAEVFPGATDVIDANDAIRQIGMKLNAPASMMRDEKEVQALQADRKAEQESMQQAMVAEQQGKAAQAQGEGQQALQVVE